MIAIGSDHGGYALKQEILNYLNENNILFHDYGCYSDESVDYAEFAQKVGLAVTGGECEKGILICGTGIGISIAANKIKGVRAACCSNEFTTRYTRLHNDANILCMGGRVTGPGVAIEMVKIFLETEFEGGRHARRIAQIKEIEDEQ